MWTAKSKPTNNNKRRRIQSSFAEGLKLSNLFTKPEQYDKFLDLDAFFHTWLNLARDTPLDQNDLPKFETYLKDLNSAKHTDGVTPSDELVQYLTELSGYLVDYYKKINILANPQFIV
ncbi:unnamed protein product [Ambrosiozyma monospora]|uniref:Unnamed protein product n=1 Tax=Ambrosiozyma monospora TaxID=43982 RepID=A0ACB5UBU6_AMBMO|nr:unnamed protein product [Ambrosiozyma monospora]